MDRKGLKIFNDQEVFETDVLVIGGGITGIGLFRDLSLHGINCHLIDKGDFCSQTSSASSKMLHGGIRYLANLDFSLVKEALEEKNLWLRLAPHLCYEEKFFLPTYKSSAYPLFISKIGVKIYDLLSHFQNTPSGWLSKKELIQEVPDLNPNGLSGAAFYYDAVMDDTKLGLECLYDALVENNSSCSSYTEVIDITQRDTGYKVIVRDTLTGHNATIHANDIACCLGPFTDKFLQKIGMNWVDRSVPNKGIHLWLKEGVIQLSHPLVLQNKDGRVIFVIPQKEAILVGTTEKITDEEIFDIRPTQEEIEYLLNILKQYFTSKVLESDIIGSFAGVRPLVRDGHSDISEVSRHHKEFQLEDNFYVIMGGKYTTFRRMVQKTAKSLIHKRDRAYDSTRTMNPLRQVSVVKPFQLQNVTDEEIEKIKMSEVMRTEEDLYQRRINLPTFTP